MIDEAGNLLFEHKENKFRIYKFNWRVQRDFFNLILPIQGEEGTRLFGEDVAEIQDKIFSKTQVEIDGGYKSIVGDVPESIFSNYMESVELFTAIINEVMPFLVQGQEAQSQKQQSQKSIKPPTARKR